MEEGGAVGGKSKAAYRKSMVRRRGVADRGEERERRGVRNQKWGVSRRPLNVSRQRLAWPRAGRGIQSLEINSLETN